mgnify:CR=1 FL=1
MIFRISGRRLHRTGGALCLLGLVALGGCENGAEPFGFLKGGQKAEKATTTDTSQTTLVERDVEAPEIFEVTRTGLWDGRPSLGGVWVAHPDVDEPQRVIIRNTSNSKFVIGALFRRQRDTPGPSIQVSSDAAEALGMLAGAPAMLNVTALRRETAPEASPEDGAQDGTEDNATEAKPDDVKATALDPVADAAAAIDAAEAKAKADTAAAPPPDERPTQPSSLNKPYIQIGIFSVEQNARNTATSMRQNGMVPIVKKQSSRGKTFWRVIVGPAADKAERATLLTKIKGVGFKDAYPVTD